MRALIASLVVSLLACQARRAPSPPDARLVAVVADAAAPLDPALAEEAAIVKKVIAVFTCFERAMRESREDPRFAGWRRNAFTDLFFFDQIFGERTRIEQPEATLCQAAVKRYQSLWQAATKTKGLPLPGDATPEFIRASGGRTALHVLEHAELTRAALAETTGGRIRPVFEMVSYGAEQSDLYRWPDLRYHGQTEAHELHLRDDEITTSQEAFVGLVAGVINDFNEQLRQGNFDRAALFLGVACHAVQDLVFHRGMSRRQLAGLRFSLDKDLYATRSAAARAEARKWTKEIVSIAREAIGDDGRWERFMAWAPSPSFDLDNAARVLFGDDPFTVRLNYGALTSHWLSHLAYRSEESRKDLRQGLIRWEVAPLFERIRRTLENGGIALRPSRTQRRNPALPLPAP